MPHSLIVEIQYFPPIETFLKICQSHSVQLEACENYQKRSFRNRCYIATAQGIQVLSVPLKKGKNNQQNIRAVQIAYDTDWQKQHWQSLQTAYGKSPFWIFYTPQLEPLFHEHFTYLFDFNLTILGVLLSLFKLKNTINIQITTDYIQHYDPKTSIDYRNKTGQSGFRTPYYPQVFEDRQGFLPNLSILDALFCKGHQSVLAWRTHS